MNPENTEMVIVPLPYSSRIDKRGEVRMSSHTALVTDAAVWLAKENPSARIFIPGENTFGQQFPSTSDLMKIQMVRKGIEEQRIEIASALNNTEDQLSAVKAHGITNPHVVALDFHIDRANILSHQKGITAVMHQVEDLLLANHSGATKARIEKIVATKSKIMGISKVYLFERVARIATRLGNPGKTGLRMFRKVMGKDGPTITDYHLVDAAKYYTPRVN